MNKGGKEIVQQSCSDSDLQIKPGSNNQLASNSPDGIKSEHVSPCDRMVLYNELKRELYLEIENKIKRLSENINNHKQSFCLRQPYKNLFPHPRKETVTISKNYCDSIINDSKLCDQIHNFLIDINYEPYTENSHRPMVDEKQTNYVQLFCSDFYKFMGVFVTYQSYMNNLEIGTMRATIITENEKQYEAFEILLRRDRRRSIKYDISKNNRETPISYTYGYDLSFSNDIITVYVMVKSI